MLVIKDLCYDVNNKAILQGIDLEVATGELVCLLGPSGCGKSTLLKLIAGLNPISVGSISLNELTLSDKSTAITVEKRNIGMVFQNFSLFPHLTVEKNISYGIQDRKDKQEITQSIINKIGMQGLEKSLPYELSGGQQQRVALARSLVREPKLLLLDEPFANLDIVLRKTIREEILLLLKSLNISTLMVTHDPDEALRMGDKIYVMQHGKIIQSGLAKNLYHKPANSFVANFFTELNHIYGTIENSKFQSPIGDFAITECKNGEDVELAIRPEAIKLVPQQNAKITAIVANIRFLGASSLVFIKIKNSDLSLRVRVYNEDLPDIGNEVGVEIDIKNVFIFTKNPYSDDCKQCKLEKISM